MSQVKVHEFKVAMTCEGCSGAVQRVLNKLQDVENIDINLEQQLVKVKSSLSAEELLATIKKTGKEAEHIMSS